MDSETEERVCFLAMNVMMIIFRSKRLRKRRLGFFRKNTQCRTLCVRFFKPRDSTYASKLLKKVINDAKKGDDGAGGEESFSLLSPPKVCRVVNF